MYARIRDTILYFDVEGMGLVPDGDEMREQPVMFVIHGGPGSDHTGYKPVLSGLTDKAQLVYFDHRGQGRSARGDPETYTLENNVEDMEGLRAYLGLERMVVLGASYGGMVGLAYALRYPQRVSHLIVVATVSDYRFRERAQAILGERGTPEQQAIAEHLWAGTFVSDDHLREYFDVMGPLYARSYDPAKGKERRKRMILSHEAINVGFSGFLRTLNLTEQLHMITAPTLVIGARHDWICPPEFSELIARCIPGADLRIFERSGHSILQDEPQALLDVVRGFLTYR